LNRADAALSAVAGAKHLEDIMQATAGGGTSRVIPKQRKRHHSYDESVDEPAKLIESEPVELEEEVPAEENEPVERIEQDENSDTPAFEE
jgi:hypothetical protein